MLSPDEMEELNSKMPKMNRAQRREMERRMPNRKATRRLMKIMEGGEAEGSTPKFEMSNRLRSASAIAQATKEVIINNSAVRELWVNNHGFNKALIDEVTKGIPVDASVEGSDAFRVVDRFIHFKYLNEDGLEADVGTPIKKCRSRVTRATDGLLVRHLLLMEDGSKIIAYIPINKDETCVFEGLIPYVVFYVTVDENEQGSVYPLTFMKLVD